MPRPRPTARPVRPWLLAASLAVLALLPLAAGATDDGADEAADAAAAWSDEPRAVAAWPEGGGFTLRSERASDVAQDELAARYDPAVARLRIDLDAHDPEEARIGFVLGLLAVTEFRDLDGDGQLGPADEVVRRLDVAGTPAVASVEGLPGGGWRATATHDLPALSTARPRVELAVTARAAPVDGKEPTRLDVHVRALDAWTREGTHLALETTLLEPTTAAQVSADAARLGDGGLGLAAAWQDGSGSVVEGGDPAEAMFVRTQPAGQDVAYPAAITASWRPAGEGSPVPGGDAAFYIGAAIVAAAALLLPAWRRLRPT